MSISARVGLSLKADIVADLGDPIRVIEIEPLEVPVPIEAPALEPGDDPVEVEQ